MSALPNVEMRPEEVAELFELRLVTLSEELSRQAASAVLLERWGIRLGGGLASISALEDMPDLAARVALQYTELDTTLEQLQALDLPAVLELYHPSRKKLLYLALTGLDGDSATLYFSPGDFFRVPTSLLKKFWNGRARLFWRDFDSLETQDVPRRLAWARARLQALGMLPRSEDTPEDVQEAVRQLQKKMRLEVDGDVGHETRMALYSLGGEYRMPRLQKP
jgi:hypothetical protein